MQMACGRYNKQPTNALLQNSRKLLMATTKQSENGASLVELNTLYFDIVSAVFMLGGEINVFLADNDEDMCESCKHTHLQTCMQLTLH